MSPVRTDQAVRKLRRTAPVFAALGDESRLALVMKLSDGKPISISGLTHGSKMTRQAITKHLRVLEGAGLVRGVWQGRENLFELAPEPLEEARLALESVSRHWDQALARLKAFVEEV